MAKITRVNGNVQAFASAALGTERTVFGDVAQSNDLTAQFTASFLRGWGIVGPSDEPALEDFNGAMYTHGQLLAYLHQMGVAEYNAAQEYHVGSATQTGGGFYLSLQNTNVGNAPASSPAFWRRLDTGRLLAVRVFDNTTVYTPTTGTRSIRVRLQAPGGGGGGAVAPGGSGMSMGAPGGAGSYAESYFTSGFSGLTITLPAGGIGGTGGIGATASAASFGGLLTCPGGVGGGISGPSASGFIVASAQTGSPTGGTTVNARGQGSDFSISLGATNGQVGRSGSSFFGPGGPSSGVPTNPGSASPSPGAGGGGTALLTGAVAAVGGQGGNARCVIEEYD